jgi:hypothetical protein
MGPGGISVTRTLPIDAALIAVVVLRLRRDTPGGVVRWTLGDRGAVEVDAAFATRGSTWSTTGHVWDATGRAMAVVTLEIATAGDDVQLTLRPTSTLSAWWQGRVPDLLDLAQAVVDELSEELLWHAGKAGVAS